VGCRWRTIFLGYCDGTLGLSKEGEKDKGRVLFAGARESGKVYLHLTHPAIGSLHLFHYHHAHASRQGTKRIAVPGSFVKQHRGVLANRKRRLLGRETTSGRRPRRRKCDPSFSSHSRGRALTARTREWHREDPVIHVLAGADVFVLLPSQHASDACCLSPSHRSESRDDTLSSRCSIS
jgi:hypothetical protein